MRVECRRCGRRNGKLGGKERDTKMTKKKRKWGNVEDERTPKNKSEREKKNLKEREIEAMRSDAKCLREGAKETREGRN